MFFSAKDLLVSVVNSSCSFCALVSFASLEASIWGIIQGSLCEGEIDLGLCAGLVELVENVDCHFRSGQASLGLSDCVGVLGLLVFAFLVCCGLCRGEIANFCAKSC